VPPLSARRVRQNRYNQLKMKIENLRNIEDAYKLWRYCNLRVGEVDSIFEKGYLEYYKMFPERYLGVYQNESLIACCVYFHDFRKASIYRLAVLPKFRNKNIATLLIIECERIAKANGINSIYCLIEENNQNSLKLFKNNSYEVVDSIKYLIKRL